MSPRPRRTDVHAAILDAAEAAFEANGYGQTSLFQIAAAAGYTKGAIYSNFPGGKAELFSTVVANELTEASAQTLATVSPALADGKNRDTIVDSLAEAMARLVPKVQRWSVLLDEFRAIGIRDEAIRQRYNELSTQRVEKLVVLFSANSTFASLEPDKLRRACIITMGLVNTMALDSAAAPDVITPDVMTDIFRSFFNAALPKD